MVVCCGTWANNHPPPHRVSLVLVRMCHWKYESELDPYQHLPIFEEKSDSFILYQIGPIWGQILIKSTWIFLNFSRFWLKFGKIDPFIYQVLHKTFRVIDIPGGWFCYPFLQHVLFRTDSLNVTEMNGGQVVSCPPFNSLEEWNFTLLEWFSLFLKWFR